MARRIGLRDVATKAGVSVTTVSHVLNNTPKARINTETRQRVREAAQSLGYRADQLARGLRTATSGMIGLLTEEIAATPHAGRIILGAQETARNHNLTMAIINSPLTNDAGERTEDVRMLLDRRVDGIIYATVYHDVVSPPDEMDQVPSVLIGALDRNRRITSVIPDEQTGAVEAVRTLLALGHRRIAFVASAIDVPATRGRQAGYLEAMSEAGLAADPALTASGDSDARGGYAAMNQILDTAPDVTGVFSYNDRMAMGIYRALADRGLDVLKDVSVVGFDDQDPIASGLFPGLTTIALPHYDMGVWAVETLIAEIGGAPSPTSVRLPCRLVARGSTAPAVERRTARPGE